MANSLRDAGDLANQDPRTLSRLRNEANSEANIAAKSATNNLANSETSSATNSEANNAANSEALNVATSDQAISPRPKTATNEAAAAESLLAESAGQRAMGRYFGRKTQGAAASLRNKGSDLTEEEKIGQLKKIKQSAEDYEGLLMKEMIKSLRQSPFVKTAGSETYSEIAEKPFTAALTAAGGLGLSEKIVADVARQEGLTETLKEHPEIMGPNYRAKISPSRMRKAPTLYNQGQ
jgi:Rod binding domain-containing protein